MGLGKFATVQAVASDKDGSNPKAPFRVTYPMPLDPMLAQSYVSIRSASRAFEAYSPDLDAQVVEGDKVDFGDGKTYLAVAVEKWTHWWPAHLRIVLEERG